MQRHIKCQHSTSQCPAPVSHYVHRPVDRDNLLADGSPLSLDRLVQTNLFKQDVLTGASVWETHIEPRPSTLPPLPCQESGAVFPLVSQGDHPTLQVPCWCLHPCGTGVAVGELLAAGSQDAAARRTPCEWLETWIAMLGTAVNLRT